MKTPSTLRLLTRNFIRSQKEFKRTQNGWGDYAGICIMATIAMNLFAFALPGWIIGWITTWLCGYSEWYFPPIVYVAWFTWGNAWYAVLMFLNCGTQLEHRAQWPRVQRLRNRWLGESYILRAIRGWATAAELMAALKRHPEVRIDVATDALDSALYQYHRLPQLYGRRAQAGYSPTEDIELNIINAIQALERSITDIRRGERWSDEDTVQTRVDDRIISAVRYLQLAHDIINPPIPTAAEAREAEMRAIGEANTPPAEPSPLGLDSISRMQQVGRILRDTTVQPMVSDIREIGREIVHSADAMNYFLQGANADAVGARALTTELSERFVQTMAEEAHEEETSLAEMDEPFTRDELYDDAGEPEDPNTMTHTHTHDIRVGYSTMTVSAEDAAMDIEAEAMNLSGGTLISWDAAGVTDSDIHAIRGEHANGEPSALVRMVAEQSFDTIPQRVYTFDGASFRFRGDTEAAQAQFFPPHVMSQLEEIAADERRRAQERENLNAAAQPQDIPADDPPFSEWNNRQPYYAQHLEMEFTAVPAAGDLWDIKHATEDFYFARGLTGYDCAQRLKLYRKAQRHIVWQNSDSGYNRWFAFIWPGYTFRVFSTYDEAADHFDDTDEQETRTQMIESNTRDYLVMQRSGEGHHSIYNRAGYIMATMETHSEAMHLAREMQANTTVMVQANGGKDWIIQEVNDSMLFRVRNVRTNVIYGEYQTMTEAHYVWQKLIYSTSRYTAEVYATTKWPDKWELILRDGAPYILNGEPVDIRPASKLEPESISINGETYTKPRIHLDSMCRWIMEGGGNSLTGGRVHPTVFAEMNETMWQRMKTNYLQRCATWTMIMLERVITRIPLIEFDPELELWLVHGLWDTSTAETDRTATQMFLDVCNKWVEFFAEVFPNYACGNVGEYKSLYDTVVTLRDGLKDGIQQGFNVSRERVKQDEYGRWLPAEHAPRSRRKLQF